MIDRDIADSSSDSSYKIIYLIAYTCADKDNIYLHLFNLLIIKGLSVITNFALHIYPVVVRLLKNIFEVSSWPETYFPVIPDNHQ